MRSRRSTRIASIRSSCSARSSAPAASRSSATTKSISSTRTTASRAKSSSRAAAAASPAPASALFDGGAFTNVSSIKLTNDGSFFLDNRHSLDASTAADDDQTNERPDQRQRRDQPRRRLAASGCSATRSASTFETVGVLNVHLGSSAVDVRSRDEPAEHRDEFPELHARPGRRRQLPRPQDGGRLRHGHRHLREPGDHRRRRRSRCGAPSPPACSRAARGSTASAVSTRSRRRSSSARSAAWSTRNYSTLPTNVSVSIGTQQQRPAVSPAAG